MTRKLLPILTKKCLFCGERFKTKRVGAKYCGVRCYHESPASNRWPERTLRERFEEKFKKREWTECWLWTASTNTLGYGRIFTGALTEMAHRVSYKLYKEAIPQGMFVLHKCDVPACVNPEHLFVGTAADNSADCVAKGRSKTMGPRFQGEEVPTSILKEKDVRAIRADPRPLLDVAADYGVNFSTISDVRRRKSWKHVT